MTNQIQATETETQEVMDLLPEEIQDLLASQAMAELEEAKKVPFTPVADAAKLDAIIESVQKKLMRLLTIDVHEELKKDLSGFAQIESEDGETRPVALIDQVNPPLDAIIAIENKISAAIARYQKTLADCMKIKRLLSGQMFGTRLAHSAQVSRMKRVRQITVTGNDLLKEFATGNVNPKIEMEPIKAPEIIELFPTTTASEPTFEPITDSLPYESSLAAQTVEKPKVEKNKPKEDDDIYCSSYED